MDTDLLKQLREETQAPFQECQKALEEAKGDLVKAKETLRKWGKTLAEKKVEREAKEGIIETYLHPNKKVGVILDLRCESDFVAKNEDFLKLAHEICLQIAATNPLFVNEESVPADFLAKEKEIFQEQAKNTGKDQKFVGQILEGKWKKRKEEICLLDQPWIKDETKKIRDLITETIAKLGENIVIKNFSRLSIR